MPAEVRTVPPMPTDILSPPPGAAQKHPAVEGVADSRGPITILVVDDTLDMCRLFANILRRDGYRAIVAQSGEEGLELAGRERPDLILLDCNMPQMDGFEVCRRLRSDPQFEDTPVIFLTAMTSPEDKAQAFAAGGVDFVCKPVERVELLARVRTHLELAQTRAQFRKQAQLFASVVASQCGRLDQIRGGQASLLTNPACFPEVRLGVRFQPAFEAGGDFYEIVRLSEDEYGVFIADVAGHDLGVAYVTGALKALSLSFMNEAMSLSETMIMLNNSLRRFLPRGVYATACYARFSSFQLNLDVINAGHPPPLLQRRDGTILPIDLVGDVLGVYDSVTFGTHSQRVESGDRVFLYTDGLVEGVPTGPRRARRAQPGNQALVERLRTKRDRPIQETVDAVVDDFLDDVNGTNPDDIVLLGIEL